MRERKNGETRKEKIAEKEGKLTCMYGMCKERGSEREKKMYMSKTKERKTKGKRRKKK